MLGARLSEHAFGNAMDVGSFRLADGRIISIVRDWYHGDEAAQAFLRDVHSGACSHFTTVLGPGYNIFHYNHFHVDLAMHGNTSTGPRRICRPTPQATPAPEHAPDGLPEPPPMDEDLDIAQAGAANAQALALHAPGGGNLDAAIPPPAPIASYHRMPAPGSAYQPPDSVGSYRPTSTTVAADHRAPAEEPPSRSAWFPRESEGASKPHTTLSAADHHAPVPGSLYQPPEDVGSYTPKPKSEPPRGTLRADGAFAPEGHPADWDLSQ